LGNMMFDETSLAVSAVLDWECATIGPAGVDVAHWLVFDEFATSAAGVDRLAGYPERTEMINRYEAVSGRTVDDLAYFEILQCLFLATTLIRQADAAVRAGRLRPETRMGQDNTVTQMLARRLGLPVPELAADYVAHRRTRPGDVAVVNLRQPG
jgi:aminoglycoside phosphotransferase (APT) family kinase protein